MKKVSFEESLLAFNYRVLSNGISEGEINDIETLKDQLFFNQIFMSNTDEMFEKYSMVNLIEDYVDYIRIIFSNMNNILANLMSISNMKFTKSDSFERRYVMNSELNDIEITEYFRDMSSFKYQFKSGELYYISIFKNGEIAVSYVDKKRVIYNKALQYEGVFWKTESCIADYINNKLNADSTVVVKVTTNRDNINIITKVEYIGNTRLMRYLTPIFGKSALIINNQFLYTKDIECLIKSLISKKKEIQRKEKINLKTLLKKDKIIEYPVDSFITYLGFLEAAVEYQETSEIYLTLYRIGDDPAIYKILKDAVSKGIHVHVNVELCASGEKINKFWMDEMIRVGIDVTTYEVGVLKVHSKLTLIKFNNGLMISQIGTGNYNSSTTSQYTDLSLITSNEEICYAVEKVFKILDGNVNQTFNENLLVTRYNAREELYRLIDNEGNKKDKGYICIKCNSLDDTQIIKHLDRAAMNGCKINLIIRGVCTWIPQYDNVIVKSIIWDKLEHSRVFCFGNNNPTIYIGSLDLVKSKLNKRIETLVKVADVDALIYMIKYLNRYITNTIGSWTMDYNGNYNKD